MDIKHFLKTLLTFTILILIGLLGVFLINHYGIDEVDTTSTGNSSVAK